MSIEELLKMSKEKNSCKIETFKNGDKKVKLGIMGGTFNPIHNAHIAICEYIIKNLNLDKIVFIPTGDPPHKKDILYKYHRYNMVLLSIYEKQDFIVSDYEILQDNKKTYTIDTLKHIKSSYPEAELYFITGSDSINSIESWKDFREIFKYSRIVVALRPGISELLTLENIERYKEVYGARIDVCYVPQMDISSTEIRKNAMNDRVRDMVPQNVWRYIDKLSLYGGANR